MTGPAGDMFGGAGEDSAAKEASKEKTFREGGSEIEEASGWAGWRYVWVVRARRAKRPAKKRLFVEVDPDSEGTKSGSLPIFICT